MAKAFVKMPEDFLLRLSALGNKTDEIVPRVLAAGGEVVLKKVKANLRAVIGSGTKEPSRSTGELADALGVSGARMDREGNYNIKVGFAEPRRDGKSNAMLANVIEFGKHGQPPKPFLKSTKSQSKNEAVAVMVAKLDEEVGGI